MTIRVLKVLAAIAVPGVAPLAERQFVIGVLAIAIFLAPLVLRLGEPDVLQSWAIAQALALLTRSNT